MGAETAVVVVSETNNLSTPDLEKGSGCEYVEGQHVQNTLPRVASEKTESRLRKSISEADVQQVIVLGFRSLQLFRIEALQAELIETQNKVMADKSSYGRGEEGKVIDELLQRYADAIRNYETLSQDRPREKADKVYLYTLLGRSAQFYIPSWLTKGLAKELKGWRKLLWEIGELRGKKAVVTDASSKYPDIGPLDFRWLDNKEGRMKQERQTQFHSRFSMALFGGVALIVPMLIMALHRHLSIALTTTAVATVIFAIGLAVLARDASGKDVLASTAAYTAVLVVFVGTSITALTGGG